jgi:L-aspartate oxidase
VTFPAGVRASAAFRESGRVALTIAQHHGIGGVAIDAWGRTSLPGLYACGEAAGGVQGRRRTMGTGLLEAAIFGSRAAQAASGDHRRAGRPAGGGVRPALPALPLDAHRLESRLDELMGPLVLVRPDEDVDAAFRELAAWPLIGSELSQADGKIALAAIRLRAALAMLAGFREDRDCRER